MRAPREDCILERFDKSQFRFTVSLNFHIVCPDIVIEIPTQFRRPMQSLAFAIIRAPFPTSFIKLLIIRLFIELALVRHKKARLKGQFVILIQSQWVSADTNSIESLFVVLESFCVVYFLLKVYDITASQLALCFSSMRVGFLSSSLGIWMSGNSDSCASSTRTVGTVKVMLRD